MGARLLGIGCVENSGIYMCRIKARRPTVQYYSSSSISTVIRAKRCYVT